MKTNAARGAGRVGGQGLALPGLVLGDGLEGVGRRQQIHDLVEELLDAGLVVAARGEQDRRDLAVADRLHEGGLHLLLGEVALGEERLHELVVALGDHLDERLVQGRGVLRELLGDGARRRLAGGVGQVALHGHEVDDAAKGLLASDGGLEADAGAAELAGKLLHDAAAVRVLAVHPVDDHEAGEAELVAELPGFLRLDLDAGDGVHDEKRGVRRLQAADHLGDEDPVAGRVDEVDLLLLPLERRDRERNRDLPLDLLRVEVGRRVAVLHAPEARRRAGFVQEGGNERRLADAVVADDGDVVDGGSGVNLHSGPSGVSFRGGDYRRGCSGVAGSFRRRGTAQEQDTAIARLSGPRLERGC